MHGAQLDNFGGHSVGATPLPIPNREVKPDSADGTRGESPRESRTPPNYLTRAAKAALVVLLRRLRRAELRLPVGIEVPQPANALVERRMGDEERGETFLREGVRGVERLGR